MMTMTDAAAVPRRRFGDLLWVAGILGVISSRPQRYRNCWRKVTLPAPLAVILLASLAQSACLLALAVWSGVALTPAVGLRAPAFEAAVTGRPIAQALRPQLSIRPHGGRAWRDVAVRRRPSCARRSRGGAEASRPPTRCSCALQRHRRGTANAVEAHHRAIVVGVAVSATSARRCARRFRLARHRGQTRKYSAPATFQRRRRWSAPSMQTSWRS